MKTKILRLLKLYEDEVNLLIWTAALLFLIRSSGMILNNYAETAFLKRYGVEYLPIVSMLNAVATFIITGFLTAFMARMPGARLLSYLFIFCGISVTSIRLMIPLGIDLLYPILFMLKSQFELLQALLFWNMCNDLFNTRQSKRLFPILTAGGVIGLILGSFGTPYFAKLSNLDNLLYVYFVTTLLGAVTVQAMGRSYPSLIFPEKSGKPVKKKTGMVEEFKNVLPLIKDSALIKIVLVLTFMPNVVIPIMNYQFNYAVNDQFASEALMIEFFGYFRGGLNIISLIILLFVGRIYGRWGLPVALMFHPFNYIIAFFGFLLRFDLFSAMYARLSTNVIRTTINMPANSVLIGLFPEAYRNMVRPFLRGTIVRLALFTGSTLILISNNYIHPRYLTLVALPFMLAWVVAPFVLKSKYASILKDLIANNLLDIKSLEKEELQHIFKEGKLLSELEESFLSARGPNAVWYAKLLKNFLHDDLDSRILANLEFQDETTKIALIKMLSVQNHPASVPGLIPHLDPEKPEVTIAIFKIICQSSVEIAPNLLDLKPYTGHTHPVVRGFATACLYHRDPKSCDQMIQKWLNADDIGAQQSGIVSAGLTSKRDYIDGLLEMLSRPDVDPIIPDIIIALSRLRARELNHVIYAYLSYESKDVKMAALDALDISDDLALKKTIILMGDASDTIHDFAKEKIKSADYQNEKLMVESLGLPNTRIRRGVFELLETFDIKEFNILMFARQSLKKSYEYLAMSESLKSFPPNEKRDLVIEHLVEKKELELENLLRVLAIHDRTGRIKTAWKGIFSSDDRQKANAVELLSDILDRHIFNSMLPLLESPSPALAIEEGKNMVKIPAFDPDSNTVFTHLVSSQDWVDVIMGLTLAYDSPHLLEGHDMLGTIDGTDNQTISKEIQMIRKRAKIESSTPERKKSTPISMGEKILLLKEIEIFSGLSAAELAAIAAVTKELDYSENSTVIKQDTIGETVFLIIKGRVDVIMEHTGKEPVVIDEIGAGGAFGEMALIDNSPRSATIQTTEPCRFLILHKQEFKETAMEFPRIALQICSVLSRRIRHLHGKFQDR